MRNTGLSVSCDSCDAPLVDYRGQSFPGAVLCHSSVYGATDVVLCMKCSDYELEEQDREGTNVLPHLLKLYKGNHE
jgi:hypothetical protein